MSKLLRSPDAAPRMVAPTTTRKLAQRMLSASTEVARTMPRGFWTPAPLDILLSLHVAEDDARYLALDDLDVPGKPSARTLESWVKALRAEDLIDSQNGLLALSQKGHDLIVGIIESIYHAQRTLD